MTMLDSQSASDGVRLLSHRPSVLYKVEHMATEPGGGARAHGGGGRGGPAGGGPRKGGVGGPAPAQRASRVAPHTRKGRDR